MTLYFPGTVVEAAIPDTADPINNPRGFVRAVLVQNTEFGYDYWVDVENGYLFKDEDIVPNVEHVLYFISEPQEDLTQDGEKDPLYWTACNAIHPVFTQVFCTNGPGHESEHRSGAHRWNHDGTRINNGICQSPHPQLTLVCQDVEGHIGNHQSHNGAIRWPNVPASQPKAEPLCNLPDPHDPKTLCNLSDRHISYHRNGDKYWGAENAC